MLLTCAIILRMTKNSCQKVLICFLDSLYKFALTQMGCFHDGIIDNLTLGSMLASMTGIHTLVMVFCCYKLRKRSRAGSEYSRAISLAFSKHSPRSQ